MRLHECLLFFLLLPTLAFASPESAARRIQAHLLIGDPKSAVKEAKQTLQTYPDEPLAHECVIKSLAAAGEDLEMLGYWERFGHQFENKAFEQDLLEEMCWGILKKGKSAPSLSSQLISVIGAALTQDMRAVPFLMEGLHHSNAHIRLVSVELASMYGDQPLKEKLCRLLFEESALDVRLQVIRAVGKLKIEHYLPHLMHLIASPKVGPKEKLAAIEAIVNMRESVAAEELEVLIASSRSGLRQLACEVIIHCEQKQNIELLYPLLADPQPDVRVAALKAWGLLKEGIVPQIKALALESIDPKVGIMASWVWLIQEPEGGERGMLKWLGADSAHVRALAASAIAASGKYGTPLAKKVLAQTNDPYVKANLALALIGQREQCDRACAIFEELLQTNHDKWMISENEMFDTIEKSTLKHNPTIPNFPEVMNQTVRLTILNLLAILESPGALDAVTAFLKQSKWGVTGLAAETLLGEGDETAFELVRELLNDPSGEVRLDAALILATWAKDDSALPILLELYPTADRQTQIKILESLGRVGNRQTLPFLIERLKEPSLTLRMIAASVLLQALNH